MRGALAGTPNVCSKRVNELLEFDMEKPHCSVSKPRSVAVTMGRKRTQDGGRRQRWCTETYLGSTEAFRHSLSLQNVRILPRTVLYMADSETFISLEECRGRKRGIYREEGCISVVCFVFDIVPVLRASLLRLLGTAPSTQACVRLEPRNPVCAD